ncbi:hypothetical protein ABZV80_42770 [Streptomyces sp. NPDC005132]|uniref:hypothetical protein n=1 Tax=Streptomyces sp. NPDC005132 TaxID=3154294 RepID=UPI0033BF96E9
MGEQESGEAAGGCHGAVAFGAALVEVADQQVGAAGIAQFPDLVQEVGDGDGRVVGPPSAQVVAVGVDQGGPVARGDAIGRRFGDAGVAFDGVQGEVQSAEAVEQADAGVEEGVDLVPALAGGLLVDAAGPGGLRAVQQGARARPSARTLSHRFRHRCQRSLT